MLNQVLIDRLAVDDSHFSGPVNLLLPLFWHTNIDPHFEAALLLALLVEQELDEVDSVRLLVVKVEMVEVVDLVNFCEVVRDDQALAHALLVQDQAIHELFLWQRRIVLEHLLDICEVAF